MRPLASLGLSAVLVLAACAASGGRQDDFVEVPDLGATRIDVPRPTTDEGEACAAALPLGESVAARAAALRRIGLFTDRAALSDAAIGTEVERAIAETWGNEIDPEEPMLDLLVAEQDTTRVWWRDLEADVAEGNNVYRSTLEEWAAISAGAFAPRSIEERWESDTGPVKVTFQIGGATHVLEPEYLEDWIDPRIATEINELIAASGLQFVFFKAFDQTAFVVSLTSAERDALEERGWCFE